MQFSKQHNPMKEAKKQRNLVRKYKTIAAILAIALALAFVNMVH